MIDLGNHYYYLPEHKRLYVDYDWFVTPDPTTAREALNDLWYQITHCIHSIANPDSYESEFGSSHREGQAKDIAVLHLTIARIEHLIITEGLVYE